jgi:hypothetical protein
MKPNRDKGQQSAEQSNPPTDAPSVEALCKVGATLAAGRNISPSERRELTKIALDLWDACREEVEKRRGDDTGSLLRENLAGLDTWLQQQPERIPFLTALARLLPSRNSNDRQKVFRDFCKHKFGDRRGQKEFNRAKSEGIAKSGFIALLFKFGDWYGAGVAQSKAEIRARGLAKANKARHSA